MPPETARRVTPARELRERYLSVAPDGVLVVDDQGVIELVNPMVETIFGYTAAELVGRPVEILVPDTVAKSHRAHRTRYRAEPATRPMGERGSNLTGRRRDGSTFPVEISLSPVNVGTELKIMACIRDVTDRQLVEAERRRVGDALDAVHEGVFMFDPETLRFVYVNNGAVGLVGYPRDELLADMTPMHLCPEFTEQSFRTLVDRLLSGGRNSMTVTTVHRHRDGHDVNVEVVLEFRQIEGPLGDVVVCLSRDITERLAAERRARQANEALRIAQERERIARDLHDVVIQRLFATGMRLQASLSDPAELHDEANESVTELDETIAQIRRTIYELTDRTWSLPSTQLRMLADSHTDLTGAEVKTRFSGEVDSLDDEVVSDLEATLTEALSNVARHAAADTVNIEIAVDDDITLVVEDDGVGIPAEFARGKGLDNMRTRARELGGELVIRSSSDGTTIEWRVPCSGR